jgi:uncharacterized membrane protein YfcA
MAAAAAIVFIAYTVFGMTGFGSSIVAAPFLVLLFPLQFVVPMIVVLDIFGASLLALRTYRHVSWRELKRLAPWAVLGMLAGVTLLVHAPERVLLTLLALFVLTYLARARFGRPNPAPIDTRWIVPFGLIGGVFTSLYGTGGPIYTIYMARRIFDARMLRATMGMLILVSAFIRMMMFATTGLYAQPGLLMLCAVLMPVGLCGLWLGSYLHHRLPAARVVQVIHVVLLLGALNLLYRTLG